MFANTELVSSIYELKFSRKGEVKPQMCVYLGEQWDCYP